MKYLSAEHAITPTFVILAQLEIGNDREIITEECL